MVMKMTLKEMKLACHNAGMEFIVDKGRICIRPMHFDDEGRREVRYWPDACEFTHTFAEAEEYISSGAMR